VNFPIKRTLKNERVIATLPKMLALLNQRIFRRLHSNFTAKASSDDIAFTLKILK